MLLAIAMPPGAAPDETRHLSRVYAMSEGFFGVPGTKPPRIEIPKSIPELYRAIKGDGSPAIRRCARSARWRRSSISRSIPSAASGSPTPAPIRRLVYLPHLVGVAPGRWLGLAPAALIYLGRIASLLAWIALTALAIRLAPARQWTLALLALTPMSVASAASISGDPMTNAAALLFTRRRDARDLRGAARSRPANARRCSAPRSSLGAREAGLLAARARDARDPDARFDEAPSRFRVASQRRAARSIRLCSPRQPRCDRRAVARVDGVCAAKRAGAADRGLPIPSHSSVSSSATRSRSRAILARTSR